MRACVRVYVCFSNSFDDVNYWEHSRKSSRRRECRVCFVVETVPMFVWEQE